MDKCDAGAGRELNGCYLLWVCPPIHVAGDHISAAEYFLDDSDVAERGCPFHVGLQVDDVTDVRCAGYLPAKVQGTHRPLPGVRICRPGDVDAMKFIVALGRPPGTLPVWEIISRSSRGRRIGRG